MIKQETNVWRTRSGDLLQSQVTTGGKRISVLVDSWPSGDMLKPLYHRTFGPRALKTAYRYVGRCIDSYDKRRGHV